VTSVLSASEWGHNLAWERMETAVGVWQVWSTSLRVAGGCQISR
jgi:hypothetical protein